jgi:glycosyltransferase involved in cell wall biosynthesis
MAVHAKVTVGVPVFNGATTLRRAVESIVRQTCRDRRVHISDNASTDATSEVGQALANEYPDVAFTRHTPNLGPAGNYRFLLQQAKTEYFMWLAADDYIEPTYVERALDALEADPTLVACVSRVRFFRSDGSTRLSLGTDPLLGDPATNLAVYLSDPSDNGRFYSLYRTVALQKAFPLSHFHAFDWAASAGTLLYGKHREIPDVLMIRDLTPTANYAKSVRVDNPTAIARIFPLIPMTADLVLRQKIPLNPNILKALTRINIDAHLAYMDQFHSSFVTRHLWKFWRQYIAWRLVTALPGKHD